MVTVQAEPQAAIRVMVAIEAASLRIQLVRLINGDARLTVIAQASSGRGALRLLSEYRTDVLLLDAQMSGVDFKEIVGRVHADHPGVEVVLLGAGNIHAPEPMLSCEAASYVSRTATDAAIITSLIAISRGWVVTMHADSPPDSASDSARPERIDGLTAREVEVLTLAARGYGYKQIGHRLGITKNTVRNHITHIYAKIGVRDRSRAALYAAQHHLVKL